MTNAGTHELSDADYRLIALLQVDGRRSSTEIARELGVSESTVRRRIDWLIQEKFIQISAVSDPMRVGFSTWVIVQVQVDLNHLETVTAELAKMPEVFFVAVTTGAFDIYFTATFTSNQAVYNFMTKKLARLKGIRNTASSTVLQLSKRTFAFGNPRETDGDDQ